MSRNAQKIYSAKAWGRDFAQRIKGEKFRVHSVFRRVVNIQSDPPRPLLSLVVNEEAMGPNSLLVSADGFDSSVKEGSPVVFSPPHLSCGNLKVNCSRIKNWKPLRTDYDFGGGELNNLVSWLNAAVPGFISTESRSAWGLIEGLKRKDMFLLTTSLDDLIGKGEGLTPSGDDFTAGVIAAYVRGNREREELSPFIEKLQFLIEQKGFRTNAVSQTMLWYASRGEGALYITEVIDAIYSNSGNAVRSAQRLWRIGASSGRYLLAGIIRGCRILLDGRR